MKESITQAAFTEEGRETWKATKLTEKPQLEEQGGLLEWGEAMTKLEAWKGVSK